MQNDPELVYRVVPKLVYRVVPAKFDDLFGHAPLRPHLVCRVVPSRWERFIGWFKAIF